MNDTVIVNGSPNMKKGNTEIFIQRFIKGMGSTPEVCYISGEKPAELAEYISAYDTILVFMPLYVHAMPGSVMKLLENMKEARNGQRLGFIVQLGFVESSNAECLAGYLRLFSNKMGYEYLGAVIKGNSAGTRYMPERMNRKLFDKLEAMGERYASDGVFDEGIMREFADPYRLSKSTLRLYRFTTAIGLNNMFWHKMMKEQNGYEARMDKPFEIN